MNKFEHHECTLKFDKLNFTLVFLRALVFISCDRLFVREQSNMGEADYLINAFQFSDYIKVPQFNAQTKHSLNENIFLMSCKMIQIYSSTICNSFPLVSVNISQDNDQLLGLCSSFSLRCLTTRHFALCLQTNPAFII